MSDDHLKRLAGKLGEWGTRGWAAELDGSPTTGKWRQGYMKIHINSLVCLNMMKWTSQLVFTLLPSPQSRQPEVNHHQYWVGKRINSTSYHLRRFQMNLDNFGRSCLDLHFVFAKRMYSITVKNILTILHMWTALRSERETWWLNKSWQVRRWRSSWYLSRPEKCKNTQEILHLMSWKSSIGDTIAYHRGTCILTIKT